MSSAGAIFPNAIEGTLLDFLSVAMNESVFNLDLPHVDVEGWPQCAEAPASAIDVVIVTVPFNTYCHSSSSLRSPLSSSL